MIVLLGRTIHHGDPGSIPDQSIRAYDAITGNGKCSDQITVVLPFIIHLP